MYSVVFALRIDLSFQIFMSDTLNNLAWDRLKLVIAELSELRTFWERRQSNAEKTDGISLVSAVLKSVESEPFHASIIGGVSLSVRLDTGLLLEQDGNHLFGILFRLNLFYANWYLSVLGYQIEEELPAAIHQSVMAVSRYARFFNQIDQKLIEGAIGQLFLTINRWPEEGKQAFVELVANYNAGDTMAAKSDEHGGSEPLPDLIPEVQVAEMYNDLQSSSGLKTIEVKSIKNKIRDWKKTDNFPDSINIPGSRVNFYSRKKVVHFFKNLFRETK